jgi:hypothetical protein
MLISARPLDASAQTAAPAKAYGHRTDWNPWKMTLITSGITAALVALPALGAVAMVAVSSTTFCEHSETRGN